ncbi:MAG: DCC1-like thiol-disulfide oxidoreductase family protein [Planctomycetota bacterium]
MTGNGPILLFDGACNLCHGSVQFVLRRERTQRVRFASLQSNVGRSILQRHGLDANALDTVVYVDGDAVSTKSDAALEVARELRAPWSWVRIFGVLPRGFRNWFYDRVADNRYRWFGTRESCLLPPAGLDRSRFLDDGEATPAEATVPAQSE